MTNKGQIGRLYKAFLENEEFACDSKTIFLKADAGFNGIRT